MTLFHEAATKRFECRLTIQRRFYIGVIQNNILSLHSTIVYSAKLLFYLPHLINLPREGFVCDAKEFLMYLTIVPMYIWPRDYWDKSPKIVWRERACMTYGMDQKHMPTVDIVYINRHSFEFPQRKRLLTCTKTFLIDIERFLID